MAIELALLYSCEPRERLGKGDEARGTERMMECLKAKSRAEAIAEIVRKQGGSPKGMTVTLARLTPDGVTEEVEVTYEDLLADAAPMKKYADHCEECPARLREHAFGCIGAINYPIARASEEWLIDRVRPANEIGGKLILRAIDDFGYDGEPIRNFRKAGLFEASKGLKVDLGNDETVSTNQLFQAIFCIGDPLDPGHCLGILVWLGAIKLDGDLVVGMEGFREVLELDTKKERSNRAKLAIGRLSDDPDIEAMQQLLRYLYASWILDAPLYVSA